MKDAQEEHEQSYSGGDERPQRVSNATASPIDMPQLHDHANGSMTRNEEPGFQNHHDDDASEVGGISGLPVEVSSGTVEDFNTTQVEVNLREHFGNIPDSFHSRGVFLGHATGFGPSPSFSPNTSVPFDHTRPTPQQESVEIATSSVRLQRMDHLNLKTSQKLLKYYIDNVAPWFEVCSLRALYSTYIPVISSRYSPLRHALYALSATQGHGNIDTARGDAFLEASMKGLGSDVYRLHEEFILTQHLLLVRRLILLPMRQWRQTLMEEISMYNKLGIHGFLRDTRGTASWLVLRFDIAMSISSRVGLTTDLRPWQQAAPPSSPSTGNPALGSGSSSELSAPILKSHIGKMTFSKPGLVSKSCTIPTSFPILVYTNRPYFYIQLLGNLAHMLLSQCKPRQVQNRAPTGLNTAPQYAVQICGLVLSNPILWSWDPVIVVTLLFVGPSLSYSEQQVELLKHLRLLRKITGWDFDQEIQELKDLWKAGY